MKKKDEEPAGVMKRLQRLVSWTLGVALVVAASLLGVGSAVADSEMQGLYLRSEPVAASHVDYAHEVAGEIVSELSNIGIDLSSRGLGSEVSYGQPFVLNEITYVPVICKGVVIALLAITEDSGQLSWTLSEDFSEGLNSVSALTSPENPAQLYTDNGNVVARIGSDDIPITSFPELDTGVGELPSGGEVIEVNDSSFDTGVDISQTRKQGRASTSKYLALDLKEQQGSQSWCSAFAGAQILRYVGKGDIRASHIMSYFYPKSKDLASQSITNDQLIKYANQKKSSPKRKSGTLSDADVKSQINSSRPIYLGAAGSGNYTKSRHALVLRGYSESAYSVWNPWNKSYTSMSKSAKSISVTGGKFTWDATIYNW